MADTTDDMKTKLKGSTSQKPPANCLSTGDFESFVQKFEEMQGTVTSTHDLLLDLTNRTDFEPPVLAKFREAQLAVAKLSGSMSKTTLKLDTQVKRIETASTAVLELRIRHLKKLIVASILLCSLPSSLVAFLVASRAGLL